MTTFVHLIGKCLTLNNNMKKFYYLLTVAVALGISASAQLSRKAGSGKNHARTSNVASARQANPLKKHSTSLQRSATTLWSDDFSTASNWILSASVGTDNWVIRTNGPHGQFPINPIHSTTAANGFALFDSDSLCSGDQVAELTYGSNIDLSGTTSARLVFQQYYRRYFDSTYVFVSNDGGTSWTQYSVNANTINNNFNSNNAPSGSESNPDVVSINISSVAAGSSQVRIRFQFYSPATLGPSAGCAYAWMVDDVSIEDIPANDIGIATTANPSQYSSTPILQVTPLTLGARVVNNGGTAATNVGVTIDIFDASLNNVYTGTTNTAASLASGDTTALLTTSTGFTPSDTGIYYIQYVCFMTDPDANTSNDTTYRFIYVDDSTYARDETFFDAATYLGGYGFLTNTGYLGQMFDIVQASGLTSVSFFIDAATPGDVMSVDVFDVASGLPNTVIGSTGNYTFTTADTGGAFITLPFTSMINVIPGRYFVAVNQQSTNNITLGASSGVFTPNAGFFQVAGGAWTAIDPFFNLSFILRPNNPSSTFVGVKNVDLDKNITVFPNPSKGYVFIMTNKGAEKDALVTVSNTMGQIVYSNTFSALDNAKIDLRNQADGIYTVRVQTANGVMTKNIMVSNK